MRLVAGVGAGLVDVGVAVDAAMRAGVVAADVHILRAAASRPRRVFRGRSGAARVKTRNGLAIETVRAADVSA